MENVLLQVTLKVVKKKLIVCDVVMITTAKRKPILVVTNSIGIENNTNTKAWVLLNQSISHGSTLK